ncbi:MAG: Gfo/Idh/MocA family oxidoreductase [Verrucomicrobia bacterium]|nr:Gfo/Idh/MocA family oxidoreductase [Verrucomicrobiota bacterium]
MNAPSISPSSRRDFLKTTSRLAAASALAGVALPHVHGAEGNTLQVALIGCGGRGTGAAAQALSTKTGPVSLVAMADVFEHKLNRSYESLKAEKGDLVDVPPEYRFIGFDGYKKAMDCLKPGDVAIFATPPAFRWVHFQYAVDKGLHVFMEKPVTVDGPTTRKMLKLADEADRKNLKVGVGLMVRHCKGRQELKTRIDDGQIGDLITMRAYRMGGRAGLAGRRPPHTPELLYQIQRFHAFLWASGGLFSDYNIHQIDECCWMKGAWPIRAHATGGRHFRGDSVDQNFDNYSVEYTFEDGTRLFFIGRAENGCHSEFASYVHGTKGSGIVSTAAHYPGKVRLFKGQTMTRETMTWAFPQPEPSPYQLEWDDLMAAIRENTPYNEAKRGAIASLVTSMGRMAAHTGQIIEYNDILNGQHEFAPNVDQLTMASPAPLLAGPDGTYPVPEPGVKKTTEY